MKRRTKLEGKSYTYAYLWSASNRLMDVAADESTLRPAYFYLSAMVMTFFTLEAYLNHLGEYIAPDKWRNERRAFKGPMDKLNFLASKCKLSFKKSEEPYLTLKELHALRNFIAHGKTEIISKKVEYILGEFPPFEENYLEKHVDADKARKAISNTELVIRQLHNAANSMYGSDKHLGNDPLGGYFGFQVG